jgi:hypothetical protein
VKILDGKIRMITIVCAIIIAGVLIYCLVPGTVFQPADGRDKGTTTIPIVPLIADASFDIMEANVSEVRYINITHVAYNEMQIYPELEGYMHGVNADPDRWHNGWRYVNSFEGNVSQFETLIKEICKGKTIFECNQGTLLEYHNQYYKISYQQYGMLKRDPNR